MCCNNRFDLSQLPVVDRWDYDEIMITGGEPTLFPKEVRQLVQHIRDEQRKIGFFGSIIYLYTAMPDMDAMRYAVLGMNGVCITPHNRHEVDEFVKLNDLYNEQTPLFFSMRLNLFSDIEAMLPKGTDLSLWRVKRMEWIKDCPIPDGEDFRRIETLFE